MGRYESQDWVKWQINRYRVPFLVVTQKKGSTILRLIKTMVSIFQTVFDNIDKSKMKSFLELIQQNESNCSRLSEVKLKGKNIAIPDGKIMFVNC